MLTLAVDCGDKNCRLGHTLPRRQGSFLPPNAGIDAT